MTVVRLGYQAEVFRAAEQSPTIDNLTAAARLLRQQKEASGYIFNDIRFEFSAHTDNELTRAGAITVHSKGFSYVRPSPDADLAELTDVNLAALMPGYFLQRQAYLAAEYDLTHEIRTGRIRDVEALKAWAGWPGPEENRA